MTSNKSITHLQFDAEMKALNDETGVFEGYGSVFGNVDSYNDVVLQGAFKESIGALGMPSLLWQHDAYKPIGKYLEVREDARGLYVKGELNLKVRQGFEAYALLKQGALKGLSIGYSVKEDELQPNGIRHLKKINLYEVSIVTFPANTAATVTQTRSQPDNIRDFEKFLREVGKYSQSQAKIIASKGFREFEQEQREVSGLTSEDLECLEKLKSTFKEF